MTMNAWITVFLPIVLLNVVARFFQYLFDREAKDKIVVNILVTVLQLIGVVLITMIFAKMSFNLFIFLLIISTVIINFVQTSLDMADVKGVSKETSLLITGATSSVIILGLFYFTVL